MAMNKQPVWVMHKFTGTKTIEACKMNRTAAEEILGRKIYEEDREDEPGYLVQYSDGYASWSPEKAFEEAYRVSETYLDRMKIELEDVKQRYLKGRDYSFSQQFRDLTDKQQRLLLKQLNLMEKYIYILGERISHEESLTSPCSGDDGRKE